MTRFEADIHVRRCRAKPKKTGFGLVRATRADMATLESVGATRELNSSNTPSSYVAGELAVAEGAKIGNFMLVRKLGAGAMGVVLLAYDPELDRRVALKFLQVQGDDDSPQRKRLKREAQSLAQLDHPNVVKVFGVGTHAERFYVAMEYVDGQTLGEWMRRRGEASSWREVVKVFLAAGAGLAAAHNKGQVHRDFKPANVMISKEGRVCVMDFGLVRSEDPGAVLITGTYEVDDLKRMSAEKLTVTGKKLGTPAYMSSEQWKCEPANHRSDQFSFCVVLYEALYGERPFAGDSPDELMVSVLKGEVRAEPADTQVPAWLRAIVLRGLAVNPEERWRSMDELLDALSRDPAVSRRRALRRALGALVLALLAFGTGLLIRALQERERDALASEKEAQDDRADALRDAKASADAAVDIIKVLRARLHESDPEVAVRLLASVKDTSRVSDWRSVALSILQRPMSRQILSGHKGRVCDLAVSPNGEWLASASFDSTARLWPRGSTNAFVLPHTDVVHDVEISPNGDLVATASKDGTAAIWSIPKYSPDMAGDIMLEPKLVLRGHDDELWRAKFSDDGTKLITSSGDGTARLWSANSEKPLWVYRVTDDQVWSAEFAPGGEWIVTATGDGHASVWSVDHPERPEIDLLGHTEQVRVGRALFSPDGDRIATTSMDGRVRLFHFDPDSAQLRPAATFDCGGDSRLGFSRDGRKLVASSDTGSAYVWQLNDQGVPVGPPHVFESTHSRALDVSMSPDGNSIAVGHHDGTIEVWYLDGDPQMSLSGHRDEVFKLEYSSDGRHLYSASFDGTIRVWDTEHAYAEKTLWGHTSSVSLHDSPDQDMLVSLDVRGQVGLWFMKRFVGGEKLPKVMLETSKGYALGVSNDGEFVATAGYDESQDVQLWNVAALREGASAPALVLSTDRTSVKNVDIDPKGEWLAGSGADGRVLLWQLGDGHDRKAREPVMLARHQSESKHVTQRDFVTFSPDGKWLASGGRDRLIHLWSRESLSASTPSSREIMNGARVQIIEFSPDGERLASVGYDGVVRLWDVGTLEKNDEIPMVRGYGGVEFHPDGHALLVANQTNSIIHWDLETDVKNELVGPSMRILEMEFSPRDGQFIGAVSHDGSLWLWRDPKEPGIHIDLGLRLISLEFIDDGRRVAVSGQDGSIRVLNLGAALIDDAELRQRLGEVTDICLTVEQRQELIGDSAEGATAAREKCRQRAHGWGP